MYPIKIEIYTPDREIYSYSGRTKELKFSYMDMIDNPYATFTFSIPLENGDTKLAKLLDFVKFTFCRVYYFEDLDEEKKRILDIGYVQDVSFGINTENSLVYEFSCLSIGAFFSVTKVFTDFNEQVQEKLDIPITPEALKLSLASDSIGDNNTVQTIITNLWGYYNNIYEKNPIVFDDGTGLLSILNVSDGVGDELYFDDTFNFAFLDISNQSLFNAWKSLLAMDFIEVFTHMGDGKDFVISSNQKFTAKEGVLYLVVRPKPFDDRNRYTYSSKDETRKYTDFNDINSFLINNDNQQITEINLSKGGSDQYTAYQVIYMGVSSVESEFSKAIYPISYNYDLAQRFGVNYFESKIQGIANTVGKDNSIRDIIEIFQNKLYQWHSDDFQLYSGSIIMNFNPTIRKGYKLTIASQYISDFFLKQDGSSYVRFNCYISGVKHDVDFTNTEKTTTVMFIRGFFE